MVLNVLQSVILLLISLLVLKDYYTLVTSERKRYASLFFVFCVLVITVVAFGVSLVHLYTRHFV